MVPRRIRPRDGAGLRPPRQRSVEGRAPTRRHVRHLRGCAPRPLLAPIPRPRCLCQAGLHSGIPGKRYLIEFNAFSDVTFISSFLHYVIGIRV